MNSSGIAQRLPRLWFRRRLAPQLYPLLPLAVLFGALASLRRKLYQAGLLRAVRLPVPVIVVGNLTVGGSGKTPLVLWLVAQLRAAGRRPGIISRGYARDGKAVLAVDSGASATEVGDEPLLLARRSGVPVFVGRNRALAGQALLDAYPDCDVLVSDDGMQHYRLARDAEIAVFDGRGAGNGCWLPAGPLRESLSRLQAVDAVVWNNTPAGAVAREAVVGCGRFAIPPVFDMVLHGRCFVHLHAPERTCTAQDLRGKRLCAIAGIGDPQRFFDQLSGLGLSFEARPFPDHHTYIASDLSCESGTILLMTEKDAVKCAPFPIAEAWVLPVEATVLHSANGCSLLVTLMEKIDGCTSA